MNIAALTLQYIHVFERVLVCVCSSEAVSARAQCDWLNMNKKSWVHTQSHLAKTYTISARTNILWGDVWFTALSRVHTLLTRWSSKYTNVCVSKLAAWLIYLVITQGRKRRRAFSHILPKLSKPSSLHMSNQIECDNAFAPHPTPTHKHTLYTHDPMCRFFN